MPTFIDESGETGQVSLHFRLGAVWFPTHAAAEAFRSQIREFQRRIGLEGYEFKFSKRMRRERRAAYFQIALAHPFRFTIASVDKHDIAWQAARPSVIHWACAVSLASTLRSVYLAEETRRNGQSRNDLPLNELVIVDDNQDRKFLAIIKETFRGLRSGVRRGASLVGKVKFRGSGPEELIQLADMVCGAVGAFLDGDERWYNIISANDLGITRIP